MVPSASWITASTAISIIMPGVVSPASTPAVTGLMPAKTSPWALTKPAPPDGHVGQKGGGAHHVAHFGPDLFQRVLDAGEDVFALRIGVAGRVQLAGRLDRRGARHIDKGADAFGAGIAADFLEPPASLDDAQGHARPSRVRIASAAVCSAVVSVPVSLRS